MHSLGYRYCWWYVPELQLEVIYLKFTKSQKYGYQVTSLYRLETPHTPRERALVLLHSISDRNEPVGLNRGLGVANVRVDFGSPAHMKRNYRFAISHVKNEFTDLLLGS